MLFLDRVAFLLSGGGRRSGDGGAMARPGRPDEELLARLLDAPFFALPPPRIPGRESGPDAAADIVQAARGRRLGDASTAATATAFIAAAAHAAWKRFVTPIVAIDEVIVCGRGAHDVVLLETLARLMAGVPVVPSDYHGLDVDARDAAGLALLAHLSLDGEAGSVPAATGARRPVVLGSLTPGGRG